MSSKKKKELAYDRQMEQESARLFGKHVSKQKGELLLAVTLICCALPMLLGVRLWNEIPRTVSTGLILMTGEEDVLPRYMVVYGLPGLMCILNLICHIQLRVNQRRMTLPKTPVRLMGRWGFPIISVLFCSGMILQAAERSYSLLFVTPCVLGLALLLLGAHMWDCPRTARLALRFSFTASDDGWSAVHRFAGWVWLAAGITAIAFTMIYATSGLAVAAVIVLALLAPFAYGRYRVQGR